MAFRDAGIADEHGVFCISPLMRRTA
jgi:hypothetical protein